MRVRGTLARLDAHAVLREQHGGARIGGLVARLHHASVAVMGVLSLQRLAWHAELDGGPEAVLQNHTLRMPCQTQKPAILLRGICSTAIRPPFGTAEGVHVRGARGGTETQGGPVPPMTSHFLSGGGGVRA